MRTPTTRLSRRCFLSAAAGAATAALLPRASRCEDQAADCPPPGFDFPLIDFHVHLDNSTIDRVAALSAERGVKFGIVEHAGTKENIYPVVLADDEELDGYLKMLEGKGVYRGVQAEWTDWTSGFSRDALARLDYVLMDAMTFPGKDGSRVKLWEAEVESRVEMADRQKFMDRYVDFYVELLKTQPIDILANVSWLPAPLAADFDDFWTTARTRKLIDAVVEQKAAIEISSGFRLPRLPMLRMAKEAGVKFCFGTNGRYPNMGLLDYSIEMGKQLGLKRDDMFLPAPAGRKAVDRWRAA